MFGGLYFGQDGFAMDPVYPPPPTPPGPPATFAWPMNDAFMFIGGSWAERVIS